MSELLSVVRQSVRKDFKKHHLALVEVKDEADLARQILELLGKFEFLPTSSIVTHFNARTTQILGMLDVLSRTEHINPVVVSYSRQVVNPDIEGFSLTAKGRSSCQAVNGYKK